MAVIVVGGWQLYNYFNNKNSDLRLRAIPERSEILKAMQEISADNRNYNKYVQTLKELSDNYPVSRQIIIDNLRLANIYDQDKITINQAQHRDIGTLKLTPYSISAIGITTQQLDIILELADTLSITTPTVNISNNTNTIIATITIFGLSYDQNKQ